MFFVLTACGAPFPPTSTLQVEATATSPLPPTSTLQVEPTRISPTQMLASETPAVESVLKFHTLATRTNIQQIDDLLNAITDDAPHELVNLFSYTEIPCMTVNALGRPPACLAGEPEGTIVEVLPFLGSEESFLYRKKRINFPVWM